MRPLSESTARVANQSLSNKYIALGRIINQWEEIIGTDLSDKAVPVKITYNKSKARGKPDATLVIASTSSHSTTLHYQKGLILEKISRIFGNEWITDIKFVSSEISLQVSPEIKKIPKPLTPNNKKYLTEILEEIEDIEIKERLENLGKAILAKAQS